MDLSILLVSPIEILDIKLGDIVSGNSTGPPMPVIRTFVPCDRQLIDRGFPF